MFIDEISVSAACDGEGPGTRLLDALLPRATELGCTEAWPSTEPDNVRAQSADLGAAGVMDQTPLVMFTSPISARRNSGDS